MLRDVTRYGTAAAATRQLGRQDLAGKTGTTNDAIDGWFSGYGGNVVGVAWMGYDEPRSLGGREFGSTLAMPIWIDYMRVALAKVPPLERTPPEDVVNDGVDWIYPEFIDAVEERTIDIAPPADPEDIVTDDPDALPAPQDGAPEDGVPGAIPLPQVAPPVPAPVPPALVPAVPQGAPAPPPGGRY
jgi:penicillin-binding protein 1A